MRLLAFLALFAAAGLPAQEPPIVSQGALTYSLRPGDLVQITVWGRDAYSGRFQVDERGALHYPGLGEINATEMTLAELRDTIRTELERVFVAPLVTITPLFRIAVLGEVRQPGLYTVDPTLSVLDVVALAGGPSPVGNLAKIVVRRPSGETKLSFDDQAMRGRTLQEVGVRSGDQVFVGRTFFTRQDFSVLVQLAQLGLTIAIFVTTVGN